MTTLLLTGATGSIGSHTWLELQATAHQGIGWRALRGLDEMRADSWGSQASNPNGFAPAA